MKSDVISGVLTYWQAPPRCFISEPCFVPAGAGEDEGWILVLQFDAGQNQSALLSWMHAKWQLGLVRVALEAPRTIFLAHHVDAATVCHPWVCFKTVGAILSPSKTTRASAWQSNRQAARAQGDISHFRMTVDEIAPWSRLERGLSEA